MANPTSPDNPHPWEERMLGLEIPDIDWNRPITHEEIQLLLERCYPYVQMINTEASWEENVTTRFIAAPCGWVVHDYGDAMSVSPGKYLYGPPAPEEDETDSGTGGTGTSAIGVGTIIQQIHGTAEFMIELAIEKGWPGIELVSGTHAMQWAAWMAAQERAYPLLGYEPSAQEQTKRDRILRLRGIRPTAAPTPTPKRGG